MIALKIKKNLKMNFHNHFSLKKGKISVKAIRKIIFKNKEIPILNQISTNNSRDDHQHPGNGQSAKIEMKKFSGDSQIRGLLLSL